MLYENAIPFISLSFFVFSARSCWSTGVWGPEWQSLCDDAGQVPHV